MCDGSTRGGARAMRRFVWLCVALGILAAGCSSSLREVRAREPEFRFAGIAASSQLEVARCIRDVLDRAGGEGILLQELELTRDGVHVVGRPDASLSAAVFYDVAVREDAVAARLAPR